MPSNDTWKIEASPKHRPGTPARFIASERPARSSSPSLLARAWSDPSLTSSSVAMAAAAHTGFELNVPFWATRSARSHVESPRNAIIDISSRLPTTAAPGKPPATILVRKSESGFVTNSRCTTATTSALARGNAITCYRLDRYGIDS